MRLPAKLRTTYRLAAYWLTQSLHLSKDTWRGSKTGCLCSSTSRRWVASRGPFFLSPGKRNEPSLSRRERRKSACPSKPQMGSTQKTNDLRTNGLKRKPRGPSGALKPPRPSPGRAETNRREDRNRRDMGRRSGGRHRRYCAPLLAFPAPLANHPRAGSRI